MIILSFFMIISFSGLDGSGKTSLCEKSAKIIKQLGWDPKIISFFDRQCYSILGNIAKVLIPNSAERIVKTQFDLQSPKTTAKKTLAIIRKVSLLVDLFVFYIFYKFPARFFNRMIIFDRYFIDSIIQLRYLEMCGKKFYDLFVKIIPGADIQILLLGDPKVFYKRKPEYNYSYFEEKSKFYEEIFHQVKFDSISCDTFEAAEEKLIRILEENIKVKL